MTASLSEPGVLWRRPKDSMTAFSVSAVSRPEKARISCVRNEDPPNWKPGRPGPGIRGSAGQVSQTPGEKAGGQRNALIMAPTWSIAAS